MQVLKIGYEIDPVTFHRDLVADVRVNLTLETMQDLIAAKGLDIHTEIAQVLGLQLVESILNARR